MENNINNKPCPCPDAEDMYCGCVGYAYVPIQMLKTVYDPSKALCQGTIFPELDLSIEEYGKVCKAAGGIE